MNLKNELRGKGKKEKETKSMNKQYYGGNLSNKISHVNIPNLSQY